MEHTIDSLVQVAYAGMHYAVVIALIHTVGDICEILAFGVGLGIGFYWVKRAVVAIWEDC